MGFSIVPLIRFIGEFRAKLRFSIEINVLKWQALVGVSLYTRPFCYVLLFDYKEEQKGGNE